MENPPYFFLELAIFSGNLVYDVVFDTEFTNVIFEYIQGIFTRYFGDNMIFRDFLINFFVRSIISRIWHEKIFPNFYGGPMTDKYDF